MATLRTTMKGLGMMKQIIGVNVEKDGRNSPLFPALFQGHTEQNCLARPRKDSSTLRRSLGRQEEFAFLQNGHPKRSYFGRNRGNAEMVGI